MNVDKENLFKNDGLLSGDLALQLLAVLRSRGSLETNGTRIAQFPSLQTADHWFWKYFFPTQANKQAKDCGLPTNSFTMASLHIVI